MLKKKLLLATLAAITLSCAQPVHAFSFNPAAKSVLEIGLMGFATIFAARLTYALGSWGSEELGNKNYKASTGWYITAAFSAVITGALAIITCGECAPILQPIFSKLSGTPSNTIKS